MDFISNGECRQRDLAFVTICISESQTVLRNCLASLCALLVTTDPACVVVFVSLWTYKRAADLLRRSGVLPVLAPAWAPVEPEHPYSHLQDRNYTFVKLEAFRLTQYAKVVTFDVDILFMSNASGLGALAGFWASRIPKGKDVNTYVNSGIMVLTPSLDLYSEIISMWRGGKYQLHFSDAENTEQDVVNEMCIMLGQCGPVGDLDACRYNHGAWLPKTLGRRCPRGEIVARHNFRAEREDFLARSLETALRRGTCRPSMGSGVAEPSSQSCWLGQYTRERCCTNKFRWGDAQCWGSGLTYERCCLGLHFKDASRLARELRYAGRAWYGLSSMPQPLPGGLMSRLCVRRYRPLRLTLAGMSSINVAPAGKEAQWYPRSEWQTSAPPEWLLAWAEKCKGLRAPHLSEETAAVVLFRFAFSSYFGRHVGHPVVDNLNASYKADPAFQMLTDSMTACVPHECCLHQASGTNSSMQGLRTVLWSFLTDFVLSVRPGEVVPDPLASDFEEIFEIDPANPLGPWKLCYRE